MSNELNRQLEGSLAVEPVQIDEEIFNTPELASDDVQY